MGLDIQLAVELATRFNGEIINSDAMQMYKGLPVITNKIPMNERNGIPHHLLDVVELQEQPWTVRNFVTEAQRLVREIRSRGRLPMVVGGTGYYMHALLFRDALLEEEIGGEEDFEEKNSSSFRDGEENPQFDLLDRPTDEIFAKLQEVDPDIASRWHPKDRRKIQRSLEIFLHTGRKASEIYREQQQKSLIPRPDEAHDFNQSNGVPGERMRYDTLVLWLNADDLILKQRLNTRVRKMIADGLLDEAAYMAQTEANLKSAGVLVDKSKGIWVAIGYKELACLLENRPEMVDGAGEGPLVPEAEVEAIQAGTRQYAKRQSRYLRIRFANAIRTSNATARFFLLDGTDLEHWQTNVYHNSENLVEAFLNGDDLPDPAHLSPSAARIFSTIADSHQNPGSGFHARRCDICRKVLMTEKEWEGHLRSNGHKKAVEAQRKRTRNLSALGSQDSSDDVSTGG